MTPVHGWDSWPTTVGAAWVWWIIDGTVTVPDPELAGAEKEQGNLKTDNVVQRDV